jgi:hypothetical protein
MHRTKLLRYLQKLKGSIFNITWIKKNGDIRIANARMHVRSHTKGTGKSISKPDNSYITIWLMGKERGYRPLNLDTVIQIKAKSVIHNIKPEPITNHVDLTTTEQPTPDNVVSIKT